MSNCNNKISTEIYAQSLGTVMLHRTVTVKCGSTIAFSPNDVGTAYCADHETEAESDVRCPRCGVGGFKEYQLHDHYLIDCGTEDD